MAGKSVFLDPSAGFARFYRDVHAADEHKAENGPYEWQIRLAAELSAGEMPDDLLAPTGAGKTTLIEAFLYALAWQVHRGERTLPPRLFWVVDRRSVVDQVHRHAALVAKRVHEGAPTSLREVRSALRSLHVVESPSTQRPTVECQRWRGGTGLRPTRLLPDRAAIVCSTVDQVGSRLLFRGYGVSRGSRPVEAALVGTDSFVVIDEAHIAGPFAETAAAIAAVQRNAPARPGRPLRVLRMSATLPESDGSEGRRAFRLTDEELAEPRLARTVNAEKLVTVGRTARTRVGGLVDAAKKMAQRPGLVGVIANTVEEARRVHAALSKEHSALLLIGPNRSIQRQELIEAIPSRSERRRNEADREVKPKLVVATQTIEVGVDLDFDALVTACAPLDSLAQRLGRLDRAGTVGQTPAVVVHSREPCPVYGEATTRAWELLGEWAEAGEVDLGPKRITELLAALPAQRRDAVTSGKRVAPRLESWVIDALAQTSEDPAPSPDIEPYLHGDDRVASADVNVVWRADLRCADSGPAADWEERVQARPPHTNESISLPVYTVKNWLRRGARPADRHAEMADIESVSSAPSAPGRPVDESCPFVLVLPDHRGRRIKATQMTSLAGITAGATVVVPVDYGGCDRFGWIPGAAAERGRPSDDLDDLGDLDPRHPRLLFDPRLAPGGTESTGSPAAATREVLRELEEVWGEATSSEMFKRLRDPVLAWAEVVWGSRSSDSPQSSESDPRSRVLDQTREAATGTVRFVGGGQDPADPSQTFVLVPHLEATAQQPSRRIRLDQHCERVAELGRRLAGAANDDPTIARAVEIAGRYHDCGKLDPRFQRWLFLGEEPDGDSPLAKSGISTRSARSEAARKAAGWPSGKRHESLSALLLARAEFAADREFDITLATYLVAVHHGWNRPFLPKEEPDPDPAVIEASIEGRPVTVRSDETLDWGAHVTACGRLNQHHGPWGLALIEAALIQADWLASEEEQTTHRKEVA